MTTYQTTRRNWLQSEIETLKEANRELIFKLREYGLSEGQKALINFQYDSRKRLIARYQTEFSILDEIRIKEYRKSEVHNFLMNSKGHHPADILMKYNQ